MQRAGIAADDAGRVAQQSHQWAELSIVGDRIGVATVIADGECKIILAGAVIHHAAQAKGCLEYFAEFAEAFGRPAF